MTGEGAAAAEMHVNSMQGMHLCDEKTARAMFVRACTQGFMVGGAYRNFKQRRIEDARYWVVNVIRVVWEGGRSELVVHEREQGTYFAMGEKFIVVSTLCFCLSCCLLLV